MKLQELIEMCIDSFSKEEAAERILDYHNSMIELKIQEIDMQKKLQAFEDGCKSFVNIVDSKPDSEWVHDFSGRMGSPRPEPFSIHDLTYIHQLSIKERNSIPASKAIKSGGVCDLIKKIESKIRFMCRD